MYLLSEFFPVSIFKTNTYFTQIRNCQRALWYTAIRFVCLVFSIQLSQQNQTLERQLVLILRFKQEKKRFATRVRKIILFILFNKIVFLTLFANSFLLFYGKNISKVSQEFLKAGHISCHFASQVIKLISWMLRL